jgi:deoxyribonuclease-4
MAVRRAGNADMRAMQLFTAIPKYYGDKVSIRPERVTRFKEALARRRIAPERVVVHAAYVLNVATPDETKWSRARDGLAKELERSPRSASARCASTPARRRTTTARPPRAHRRGDRCTRSRHRRRHAPLVENTAGAGRTMARTAERWDRSSRTCRSAPRRTGYGLDTCHLFASGYDLRASKAR